jgi:eukaryotic-like serine/threonine-protein kinase
MHSEPEITNAFDPLDGIIAEYLQAIEAGKAPSRETWLAQYPEQAERLRAFLRDWDAVGQDASKFKLPASIGDGETVGFAPTTNLPTLRYLGDYELVSEIARGGMGVVYRARQVSLNRTVAIKMILAGTYATSQAVQRFRAEAEAAANLDHPNILPIYEVGEHEGHQYFSMKLVEGGSLSGKIEELKSQPKQIASLMTILARAVHFAHQRGILHRDLKPANVLLDQDGTPFITDFGLAKKVNEDDGSTRTGSIVGTPSYMAPEQARGEKGLTTSVDIYSLGAILYEMLTGKPPFKGETVFATVKQVMEQEPEKPTGERDLGVIALKCLSKETGKRYASALELAEDLERWTRGEAITARPVGRVERVRKWVKRNKLLAAAEAVMVLAVIAFLGMQIYYNRILAISLNESTKAKLIAEQSAEEAKAERQRADAALRVERRSAYINRIGLASREAVADNWERARQLLDICPPDLRGWEWHYLSRRYRSVVGDVDLGKQTSQAAVAYSPDGSTLAILTYDGKLHLCDPITHAKRSAVQVVQGEFERGRIAYFPDSRRLAVAVNGKPIVITDTVTRQQVGRTTDSPSWVESLDVSPDGSRLLTAAARQPWDEKWKPTANDVRLWDAQTGRELRHWPNTTAAAFGPSGGWVAVSDRDGGVRLCDVASGAELRKMSSIEPPLTSAALLAVSADGRRVAASYGKQAVVWTVADGNVVQQLKSKDYVGNKSQDFRFSPDGNLLAFGHTDRDYIGGLTVWDVTTGTVARERVGYEPGVEGLSFRPDGRRLATAHIHDQVQVWNGRIGEAAVVWTPPDQTINTAAGVDAAGQLWTLWMASRPDKPTDRFTVEPLPSAIGGRATLWGQESKIDTKYAANPVVGLIAVGSTSGYGIAPSSEVKLHDSTTGRLVKKLNDPTDKKPVERRLKSYAGWSMALQPLKFSPDGNRLLVVRGVNTAALEVWNVAEGRLERRLPGEAKGVFTEDGKADIRVTGTAWSPDGQHLAIIRGSGRVEWWNTSSGERLWAATGGQASEEIAISSDGRKLAICTRLRPRDEGCQVVIYNTADGSRSATMTGLIGQPHRVAFDPTGQTLATIDDGGRFLKTWETASGQELLTVERVGDPRWLGFLPDGRLIVVNSYGIRCFDGREKE